MTTIAVDQNWNVAADGLALYGGTVCGLDEQKLFVRQQQGQKMIFGLSGILAILPPLMNWYMEGAEPERAPRANDNSAWTFLAVRGIEGKAPRLFIMTNSVPFPAEMKPPMAVGSGGDYALALMHAGYSAKGAIQLIINKGLDVSTGGTVLAMNAIDIINGKVAAEAAA